MAGSAVAFTAAAAIFSQIAFAATLFSDNFSDGDTSGWSKSGGTWAVVSGAANQSNADSENARLFAGDSGWTNYTVSARVQPSSIGSNGFVGLLARSTSSTTFYRLALLPGNAVQLQAVNSGSVTVLGSASRTVSNGTWYTLSLTVSGSSISGSVDGSVVGSGSSSVASKGRIGIQTGYASASFDDVTVSDAAGPGPTTTGPTTGPTSASPTPSRTPTPTPTGTNPSGSWPSKTGDVSVSGTISVSGTLDGGMKRYCCIGDGGQSESQDPMFEVANGGTIKNVIIGAPAGDGIHCLGTCTIQNVWWEDVGEDAATFMGTGGGTSYVIGGGARSASDKVFQHNGNGTVNISGFSVESSGKLYRACGNCTNSFQRHVVVSNIRATSTKVIAGINTNWGDTARFSNITIVGDSSHKTIICDKYKGVPKGSEPSHIGSGPDSTNCLYNPDTDIHWV
ncbi:pectate lyase [Dactylosporangium sp. AC04546]|uniref:pectate lyase n=1 Tax=Dactylosporangium sp. AC04546 TaxID=2862460 RepID=UPI001EDFEADC|nr:pectate lyase [Dactylosporangium sp. AC04546]WVK87530.1 pectate lyase [Dactylosporangium sp. AC04546]